MNSPFVPIVLAYVVGILLAQFFHPPLLAFFIGAFVLLAAALAIARFRLFLLWPLLIIAGSTNFTLRTAVISPIDLRSASTSPTIVTLRGQLSETPRLKVTEFKSKQTSHTTVPIHVVEMQHGDTKLPVNGEVMVNTPGMLGPEFFAGQTIQVYGVIAPPSPPMAQGLFDYRQYLANRGIFDEVKTKSADDLKIIGTPLETPPLTDRFLNWAAKTLTIGLPAEDEPLHLLWAMTLGWRSVFAGDVGDPFLRAGTMHMFAIDGLRIALLSGIIVTFLRVLRLSRIWCGFIAVPMIWFYTAATGWEPPAVRASVMMTIVLGGWCIQRPGDLLNSLALAAFIILIQEPRQLFEAGFQLSFFVVLVIVLMLPPMNAWIDRVFRQDPLLPDELLPGWKVALFSGGRLVARFAALSFAAWVGSIPLSAKYFHLFSPVSTLTNIFAVPCGTLALMANMASLICGAWLPWASGLFNHAAWFFMVAMTWVSETATQIPGAYFYVKEPPTAAIIIYYAVIISILSGWFVTRRRKIFGMVVLCGLAVAGFCWWMSLRNETELTVLPLEGGHAVYVEGDGWLVNCGNKAATDSLLKNFLRSQGVNRLPRLVLTEGDAKNCGGAEMLDGLFPVSELWTSGVKFRSPEYNDILAYYENPPLRHKTFELGQKTGRWQVLHPDPASTSTRADDNALVLLGNFFSTRVLLLSDLSREGQSTLLSRTNDLHADIVVAGLPEIGEPLCDALLAKIHPKVIVIADSESPANRRAKDALIKRLEQSQIPLIYTRESGAVTIVTRPDGWNLQTMTGEKLSFSHF